MLEIIKSYTNFSITESPQVFSSRAKSYISQISESVLAASIHDDESQVIREIRAQVELIARKSETFKYNRFLFPDSHEFRIDSLPGIVFRAALDYPRNVKTPRTMSWYLKRGGEIVVVPYVLD